MDRFIRSAMSGFLLSSVALFAHHLAGGHTVSGLSLLSSLLILISISLLFSHSVLEGPRLALLIIFSQLFTHILLGANSGNSINMAISHIISGFFAYSFIAHIDQSILWLSARLAPILLKPLTSQSLPHKSSISFRDHCHSLSSRFVAFQYWTTSPPLVATFS